MISTDRYGIVDNNGDCGDSANRSSLWVQFENASAFDLSEFVFDGICVRHPVQIPWNNYKNFSRDQLIPLVSGLAVQGKYYLIEDIFFRTAARLFFAQNIERDYPGSVKLPWPHEFWNDKGMPEKRAFDFADPIFPDVIWHMVLCGRIWPMYWFAPLGFMWFILSLVVYCRWNDGDDDGQIISQCAAHGKWALRAYRFLRPRWEQRLWAYWRIRRNQIEIYAAITRAVKNA